MINFYSYHRGDLDNQDLYKSPISYTMSALYPDKYYPEIEHIIKKDPGCAYWCARIIKQGRWLEAEPYIMKSPFWVTEYAENIIGGRWLEAEQYIMTDPYIAYQYARHVMQERWIEAEPYINQSLAWRVMYEEWFKVTL